MDFYILTPAGKAHILSTDDDGRILTPLPAAPEAGSTAAVPAQLTAKSEVVYHCGNEKNSA